MLSREERARFADWLEQEARDENGLAKQMEAIKLPMANHYYAKAAAKLLVAKELRAITETIL